MLALNQCWFVARPALSCHISFVSVRFLRLSCRWLNTRRWPNVWLLLAHRLWRWANISPVLGYRVVFDATLNVGQRHRRRASINPALVQSIVPIPPICRYLLYVCGLWSSRQARSLRPVLLQCWPTICSAGALYRRWVDVCLVLLWWWWGLLLSRHDALCCFDAGPAS